MIILVAAAAAAAAVQLLFCDIMERRLLIENANVSQEFQLLALREIVPGEIVAV
jgi:hypothetical protein